MNYLFLGVFTLAFAVGLAYTLLKTWKDYVTLNLFDVHLFASSARNGVLVSAIRTAIVVVSLTLCTISAAKRGYDLNFLHPVVIGAVPALMVFTLIQILFPMRRVSVAMYVCMASIVFCVNIVHDTDYLIKQHSHNDHIWAAVSLYSDIIGLFLSFHIFGTAYR